MLLETDSPRVLPQGLARCSVLFDATLCHAGASGVALPESLRGASIKRRTEFLAGRYCAFHALRRAGWTGDAMISIAPDHTPRWPDGMIGSITHTSEFASAAVGTRADLASLGIDSEVIVSPAQMRDIDTSVLCLPRERRLRDAVPFAPEVFATLAFSAKESVFKCLFPLVGVYFEFADVELTHMDLGAREFRYRVLRDLSGDVRAGFGGAGRFEITPRYVHTGVEIARTDAGAQ